MERDSYIIANYKALFFLFLLLNSLIALLFYLYINSHVENVEKIVHKIDRATKNVEAISSIFVASIQQKEP